MKTNVPRDDLTVLDECLSGHYQNSSEDGSQSVKRMWSEGRGQKQTIPGLVVNCHFE